VNRREALSLLITILLSLAPLPVLAQYTPGPEQESATTVHVVPSSYFSSGSASVWIAEYGRAVVLDIGDAGGFAGVAVRIPLGLGGFSGTLGSVDDFGFEFRYDVEEPSLYLFIDVTAPNGTRYLLRGNATTLPLGGQLLTATNESVEWCVGAWDGVDPGSLEPVECGLSFWEALATLPPDSVVASLGLYYSSTKRAQAVIHPWVYFKNAYFEDEYYYLTISSAYDRAGDGYTILIHSGDYSYWDLMPSDMWEDIPLRFWPSWHNDVVIRGENRNSTKLINPRISIYCIENLELSSLTVLVSKPQASIQLNKVEGPLISNVTFIVNLTSKHITEWEYYRPLQVNANFTYIYNSVFEVLVDNVSLEEQTVIPAIDVVLIEISKSNYTAIDTFSSRIYIRDVALLNNSNILIQSIYAENSEGFWLVDSQLTLWSGGTFSGSGRMYLDITMVRLSNVTGAGIGFNAFKANITPTITGDSVNVLYFHYCIFIYRSNNLYIESNSIDLVHRVPKGGARGIYLAETNNTVVRWNDVKGDITRDKEYLTGFGITIRPMIYVGGGGPMFSRDVLIANNTIRGFDIGIDINAEGKVEVNETVIRFPDMVSNVTILYNEIVSNLYGVLIYGYNGSVYPGEAHYNSIYGNTKAGLVYTGDIDMTPPPYNASYNWWGDISGPYVPGFNDGVGDAIYGFVENVIFKPWLSAPPPEGTAVWGGTSSVYVSAGEVSSVKAIDEADMEVLIEAGTNVSVTLSLLKYEENPAPEPPPFSEVKYVDVKLVADNTSALTEIEVRIYYRADEVVNELNLGPFWWDGSSWVLCSEWGINTADVDGYGGYVWVRVRHDTSPSIEDLRGTPIALVEGPYPIPEAPFTAIAVSIAALASTAYVMWRRTRSGSPD